MSILVLSCIMAIEHKGIGWLEIFYYNNIGLNKVFTVNFALHLKFIIHFINLLQQVALTKSIPLILRSHISPWNFWLRKEEGVKRDGKEEQSEGKWRQRALLLDTFCLQLALFLFQFSGILYSLFSLFSFYCFVG